MKKNLRIDFIIGRMNSGGAQRVVANLSNFLINHEYEIRIITFMDDEAYVLDKRIQRLRFHNRRIFRTVLATSFFSLIAFYFKKKNRPDIISAHIGDIAFPAILISKLYGLKIIASEHSNHVHQEQNLMRKVLWNNLYKRANAITVLTNYDLPFFMDRNKNSVVMENPCSFEPLQDNSKEREKVILSIGSLNRYSDKGFDTMLKVAAKVLPNFPDWKLKIIGEGDKGKKELEALTNELNLNDQVDFLGFRNDVREIMQSSEIYVLTSKYEGLPMVLLEALSQKMACIAFDCVTGPSEIIQNNINGFLIEDQNSEEMSAKLKELIENDLLRQKFQQNSSEVLDKYSLESVGKKWIQLFESLVKPNEKTKKLIY